MARSHHRRTALRFVVDGKAGKLAPTRAGTRSRAFDEGGSRASVTAAEPFSLLSWSISDPSFLHLAPGEWSQ
jgi:hypothetical protein